MRSTAMFRGCFAAVFFAKQLFSLSTLTCARCRRDGYAGYKILFLAVRRGGLASAAGRCAHASVRGRREPATGGFHRRNQPLAPRKTPCGRQETRSRFVLGARARRSQASPIAMSRFTVARLRPSTSAISSRSRPAKYFSSTTRAFRLSWAAS
jgi:hypothetical protein